VRGGEDGEDVIDGGLLRIGDRRPEDEAKMAMRRRRKGTAPNMTLKAIPPARKNTSS
jgi:hypothetical protein